MHSDQTARIISRFLEDQKHMFVFPSEVAGDYRMKEVLENSAARAVRTDRFLSWDRLKEHEFSPSRERIPANIIYRTIFSAVLLEEHRAAGPLLHVLAGGKTTDDPSVFQHQIAAALPQLKRAVESLPGVKGSFPEDLARDLNLLYRRYLLFLDESGLFEPSYSEPELGLSDHVYHIFYPELIEDFREYLPLLEGRSCFVIHPVSEEERGSVPVIVRYSDARQELASLVSNLHILLKSGMPPAEIAVSLVDYEGWQPALEEEAEIRDIPLDFRAGKMLAEYPAGALFQRLSDLLGSGMHLEKLKQLLLDPAYPWMDRESWAELIRFGIDHFYLTSWKEKNLQKDELSRKLNCGSETRLLKKYRNLKAQISRLIQASSVRDLRGHVHTFLHSFFEAEGWDPLAERILQYCLYLLQEIEEVEERLGPVKFPSPFGLWTSLLSRRRYVSPGNRNAIPVYQYRVSAGITPACHFIPGAGQGETRVRREEFTFLRDDYRSLLVREEPADTSAAFLRVYAGSGKEVIMSCSDRGFSGPQLPPSEIVAAGNVRKAAGRKLEKTTSPRGPETLDPYLQEEHFWRRELSSPSELFSLQERGFGAIRSTGFAPKGTDFTREGVKDSRLFEHLKNITLGERGALDGRIWFTPTSFDLYSGCPFAYLLQKGFNLASQDYSTVVIDHFQMGRILHRIFSQLYNEVRKIDGCWEAEHEEMYLKKAEGILTREFQLWQDRGMDFIGPAWQWFQKTCADQLEVFVRQEGEQFDGFELAGTETELAAVPEEGQVGMWGRIDRLSRRDGCTVLIDYKKGKVPSTGEVYQEEGLPAVSQLPFYTFVAERNGHHVTAASYYSIQEGSYTHIFNEPEGPVAGSSRRKPRLDPLQFRDQMDRIVSGVIRHAENLRRGIFTAPENCGSCDFRTICRTRYGLKLPEDSHGR